MPPLRIVVTGATGNVGTALLARLSAQSDAYEVVAVARRVPPSIPPYRHACWHAIDVGDPDAEEMLCRAFDGADAVVHLAWGFQPSHRSDLLRRTAIDGTRAAAAYAPGAYGRTVDESWPATGIPTSQYSTDKVEAEKIVAEAARTTGAPEVTVLRPGLIGQAAAGAALRRYAMPAWMPAVAMRALPVLPIDPSVALPAVHAADVAAAVELALAAPGAGVVNLSAADPVRTEDVVESLGVRPWRVSRRTLRTLAQVTWRAHLQPVHGGWIDLAYDTPLLDCSRAQRVLGWSPAVSGREVWRETIAGMRSGASGTGPVLGARSPREMVADLVAGGTVGIRRVP
ncbi:NAD-dependent epimerase/dehydratase family protein [Rhodococcus sp. CX]|uniref:NAD-dependent epimerase/dehydratase family protein n=1 Tax=Rhodococcus sp. CX TaxID=2789880 RepID=UPI0018CE48F8|nr:NAD-dependent epimerase/dehydratase family protein [Rhodococcus sp. CX]MBH0120789.1 NAD-dependent epimerase/dehydratase family protein [Rhodococcus sp. CX]